MGWVNRCQRTSHRSVPPTVRSPHPYPSLAYSRHLHRSSPAQPRLAPLPHLSCPPHPSSPLPRHHSTRKRSCSAHASDRRASAPSIDYTARAVSQDTLAPPYNPSGCCTRDQLATVNARRRLPTDPLHEHSSMSDSPSDHHAEPAAAPVSAPSAPALPSASLNSTTDSTSSPVSQIVQEKTGSLPPATPESTDTLSHNGPRVAEPAPAPAPRGEAATSGSVASASSEVADNPPPETKAEEKDGAHSVTPSTSAAADPTTDASHPPVVASAVRVPTPSSRTSTPPLAAHAKKKFSSVSVTKEFLSKAASPVPAPAKLVRPAAVTAPSQTTSKLLSTKLTTVPTSKPSSSPNPPTSGTTSAPSAPWAKPVASEAAPALQHPAPTRTAVPNVAMGSGQGLGSAARRAWGSVSANERRGQPVGISREYPTAKEVADGKRKAMLSAQAIAQAEAAHNQAILADLNVFTHLEPNAHRWDEEDEDDDMIDFGDGRTYSSLSHTAETTHARHDQPVTKSERFGDDFDRSWPKREETRPRHEQDRPRHEQDRVLFNASSNRLEPHARGQPTQSQPRLMPRDVPRQERDRALPPHLDAGRSHHHDPSRAFPPHMSHSAAPTGGTHGPSRTAWRTGPSEREPPPHLGEQRERSNDHPARDNSARAPPASRVAPPTPHAPPPAPRPSAPAQPPPVAASAAGGASVGPSGENQAAEMHTAAEKARLRRLAEEAEREAAAERARQKARELAERFGGTPPNPKPKPAPASSTVCPIPPSSVAPPPPPGLSKPPQPPPGFAKPIQPTQPQITLAPRPKESSPQAPLTGLPQLPEQKSTAADRASSWRRAGPLTDSPHALPADHIVARRPSHDQGRISDVPRDPRRGVRDLPPHPLREAPPHTSHSISSQGRDNHEEPPRSPIRSKAPPGLERQNAYGDHIASPHPSKREANFDTMLARIQAAMAQSRPTPDVKGSDDSTSPEDERDKHSMEGAEDVGARKEAPPLAPVSVAASAQASATGPSSGPAPSEPRVPAPTRPRKAPPAPLSHRPLEFFDATQAPIPPSPPPAWRVHTVKLPKVPPQNKGPIPRARLRAAEVRISAPRGWAQTFEPPLELHAPGRILADALLLQPIGRRFAKQIETGPVVSISPRHFVPFQRKPKQRAAEPRMLPGDALSFDKTTRSAPAPAPAPGPTEVSAPQPARKPSKGRVAVPGPQAESIAEDGAKPPAVRFMVSSELDGDSLLDEVNKMSLEHIEADDKGVTEAKQLGEKPGTPPPAPVSAPRTNPTSPSNTAPGPWAKSTLAYSVTSPARDDPQREHLKSVWEQAADANAQSSAPASATSQPETPLYPTLNSPATAPDPASLKPVYQMGQSALGQSSFGARGQFGQSYNQFSGATSPDGGMGVNYGIMGRSQTTNANGFQQNLWAPSPSFPNSLSGGYAYQKQAEKPAAAAFGKDSNFSGDFRYPNSNQVNPAQAQAQAQAFQQGNYNGYQYRAQPQSYGYAHTGFGTQMAGPRANSQNHSRFVGNGEYQVGYDNYYSGPGGHGHAGHVGQYPAGFSNGSGIEQPRPPRKMW